MAEVVEREKRIYLRHGDDDQEILAPEDMPQGASLHTWLRVAIAFHNCGRADDFKTFLVKANELGATYDYRHDRENRIAILNGLAAHYSNLYIKERDKVTRDKWLTEATNMLNEADRIDIHNYMTWVSKGVLLLAQGEYEKAMAEFSNVVNASPDNISAMLGQAAISYHKEKFEEASKQYAAVLDKNPAAPASVRFGLGLTYYKLNKTAQARMAFRRVLELDPRNVHAMVGIAILDLNQGGASIKEGMEMLTRAHKINPSFPMVLNHLANHFFYKNDIQKVRTLASKAFQSTDNKDMQAESCFHIGRSYHFEGKFDDAFNWYFNAVTLRPGHILPQYNLGQMYIHKGDHAKAIACFEKVVKASPENCETLRVLGSLYAQQKGKHQRALRFLQRALAIQPEDANTLIEMAMLVERTDYAVAEEAYKKAEAKLRKMGVTVPGELYNNLGVLLQQQNKFEEAETALKKALDAFGRRDDPYDPINVTTSFNLGRLYEAWCRFGEAEKIYRGLLRRHSTYVDCHLRLGCMSRAKGRFVDAEEHFKDALAFADRHLDTYSFLGNMYAQKRELGPAQKAFEHILKSVMPHDPYSLLALGNIYYQTARQDDSKGRKWLDRALAFFKKVLSHDAANLYAANGIGIVLADLGDINAARETFTAVREANEKIPDAWLNLAHCHLMQGQQQAAIKMYQTVLRRFYEEKDVNVMLFLARAYFEQRKYKEARDVLIKILHVSPLNVTARFDFALALEYKGNAALEEQRKTLAEVETAIIDIEGAIREFQFLKHLDTKMDKNKVVDHHERCVTLLEDARIHYQTAKSNEEALNRAKAQWIADEEAMMAKRNEAIRARKDKEEQEKVKRQAAQEALRAREQQLKEAWRVADESARAQTGKKKDDEDSDGGRRKKSEKKKGRKRKRSGSVSSASSRSELSEREEGGVQQEVIMPVAEADDKPAEGDAGDEEALGHRRKRRRVASDDEDEAGAANSAPDGAANSAPDAGASQEAGTADATDMHDLFGSDDEDDTTAPAAAAPAAAAPAPADAEADAGGDPVASMLVDDVAADRAEPEAEEQTLATQVMDTQFLDGEPDGADGEHTPVPGSPAGDASPAMPGTPEEGGAREQMDLE